MSVFSKEIYSKIKEKLKEQKDVQAKVKNPGILDIPNGKNFYQMPLKHFIGIAQKRGKGAVQKALGNLERFNKKKKSEVSKKASNIIDKLKKNKEFQDIGKKNESKINEQLESEVVDQLVIRFNLDKDFAKRILDKAIDLAREQRKMDNDLDVVEELVKEFNIRDNVARDVYEQALDVLDHKEEEKVNEVEKGSKSIVKKLDGIKQQVEKAIGSIKEFEGDQVERTKIRANQEIDKVSVLVKELKTQFVLESKETNEFISNGKKIDFNRIDGFIEDAEQLLSEAKEFSLERTDRVINPLDALVTLIKELDKDVILERVSEETIDKGLTDIGFTKFNVRTLQSGTVVAVLDEFVTVKVMDFKKLESLGLKEIIPDFEELNTLGLVFRENIGECLSQERVKSLVDYKVQIDRVIEQEAPDLKDKYDWDNGLKPKEGYAEDIKEVLEQLEVFNGVCWDGKLGVLEVKVSEQGELNFDEQDLLDDIVLVAENEGDFFRNKDPRGAVDFASKDLRRDREESLRFSLNKIKDEAIEQVRISWGFSKDEVKESIEDKNLLKKFSGFKEKIKVLSDEFDLKLQTVPGRGDRKSDKDIQQLSNISNRLNNLALDLKELEEDTID